VGLLAPHSRHPAGAGLRLGFEPDGPRLPPVLPPRGP
jgi:hypothetical protein